MEEIEKMAYLHEIRQLKQENAKLKEDRLQLMEIIRQLKK